MFWFDFPGTGKLKGWKTKKIFSYISDLNYLILIFNLKGKKMSIATFQFDRQAFWIGLHPLARMHHLDVNIWCNSSWKLELTNRKTVSKWNWLIFADWSTVFFVRIPFFLTIPQHTTQLIEIYRNQKHTEHVSTYFDVINCQTEIVYQQKFISNRPICIKLIFFSALKRRHIDEIHST